MAAMRRIFAARLAEGGVREPRSLPPEIWFRGATASHETKCFSVAQRRMSRPISDTSLSAPYGPRPGSAVKSTPSHTVYNGSRISKPGSLALRRRVCPGWPRGSAGAEQVASMARDLGLDLVVAVADLGLVEVVALDRLAEHEQLLSAVVAREGGGGLLPGWPYSGGRGGGPVPRGRSRPRRCRAGWRARSPR